MFIEATQAFIQNDHEFIHQWAKTRVGNEVGKVFNMIVSEVNQMWGHQTF